MSGSDCVASMQSSARLPKVKPAFAALCNLVLGDLEAEVRCAAGRCAQGPQGFGRAACSCKAISKCSAQEQPVGL